MADDYKPAELDLEGLASQGWEVRKEADGTLLARGPDGTVHEVGKPMQKPTGTKPGAAETGVSQAGWGASGGLSDLLSAGALAATGKSVEGTPQGFFDRYRGWKGSVQDRNEEQMKEYPVGSRLAQFGGGVLPAVMGVPPAAYGAAIGFSQGKGDLTKGEIGQTALETGIGAGLGHVAGKVAELPARAGGTVQRWMANKGAQALPQGVADATQAATTAARSVSGTAGAAMTDATAAMRQLAGLDALAAQGNLGAKQAIQALRTNPGFQELLAEHAGKLATDFPVKAAHAKATQMTMRETMGQLPQIAQAHLQGAIPALNQGGFPAIQGMAGNMMKRYGEPVLGKFAGHVAGGAVGAGLGYGLSGLAGEDPATKGVATALGGLAGAGAGTAVASVFDRTRFQRALINQTNKPGVSFELGKLAQTKLIKNAITQNPQLVGQLGSLAARALAGDEPAQHLSDYVLSQVSGDYRQEKKALMENKDVTQPNPAVGF